jgi:hypothetical protein
MLSNILPNIKIDSPNGETKITGIQITELGYIYISLYNEKTMCTINYMIGEVHELLNKSFKNYDTTSQTTISRGFNRRFRF